MRELPFPCRNDLNWETFTHSVVKKRFALALMKASENIAEGPMNQWYAPGIMFYWTLTVSRNSRKRRVGTLSRKIMSSMSRGDVAISFAAN